MQGKKYFLLFALTLALIPYLYASFFTLPFADDFCFGWTASAHIPFFQKWLNQYLGWNGRYTSDILVNLHPLTLGSLSIYRGISSASILITPVAFFLLFRAWVNSARHAVVAALFASLFLFCYLPNITEAVYWYIGIVNYHAGNICFILQLAVLSKLMKSGEKNIMFILVSLLLLIVSVGFNEIAAALIPAYYLALIIWARISRTPKSEEPKAIYLLIVHLIIAFAAALFVICAPGNFTRAGEFSGNFNLLHSCWMAMLQTARFVTNWCFSIPFIALSLAVLVNADKINSLALRKVNWWVWLALLLFTVFTSAFIPYLATGTLGQHRTINYALPYFILLWCGVLVSISTKYKICEEATPETTGVRVYIMALVALVIMAVSGNARLICSDILTGSFAPYNSEFMARQADIVRHPTQPIQALKNIPCSFKITDAKSDTIWWVDKCMLKYYTETGLQIH